jgi:predicted enzyme related to lactoylglutathione lyase
VFFRARAPETLTEWYARHLGVESNPVWAQEAGPTVFAAFPADTDYFDREGQQFMLNFRVDDLDAAIAALQSEGIDVLTRDEWNSEAGRFARIHDPEGNPVELWEPPRSAG